MGILLVANCPPPMSKGGAYRIPTKIQHLVKIAVFHPTGATVYINKYSMNPLWHTKFDHNWQRGCVQEPKKFKISQESHGISAVFTMQW